jgi:hypothetical protein
LKQWNTHNWKIAMLSNTVNFYNTLEPTILWTKMLCRFCKAPTGSNHPCEKELDENVPASERLLEVNGHHIPIFAEDCFYRDKNMWTMTLNFPISELLLLEIKSIPGVESLWANTKYTGTIHISKVFPEKDVLAAINARYKTFIKSKQTKKDEQSLLKEFTFPNKKSVWVDDTTHLLLKNYFGA